MQSFIKISNTLFESNIKDSIDTGTIFNRIGTGGFTILCLLQVIQEYGSISTIRITDIKEKLNIKSTATVTKYLCALLREDVISINNKTCDSKFKSLELLNYTINSSYVNPLFYVPISVELFLNKIKTIGFNGWSLLCYLTKLHNYNNGAIDSDSIIYLSGYAYPTVEHLSDILCIGSHNTIEKTLELLENLQLIKIIKTDRVIAYTSPSGKVRHKKVNNKYIVYNKLPDNRYFIESNRQLY